MSTNYVPSTPSSNTSDRSDRSRTRSRRRRSPSGRSNDGSSGSSDRSSSSRQSKPAPKKNLTLWEKVVAFFTGSATEESAAQSRPRTEHPSVTAAAQRSRPEREERSERPERAERPARTGMRKPEIVDVTTPRVYVGNLSFDAVESDIQELFTGVGIVQSVEIVANRQTQRSKGFGFVQMQTIEEARRAVEELHDREYMGRKLVVSGAKASDRRDDRAQQPEQ